MLDDHVEAEVSVWNVCEVNACMFRSYLCLSS